MFKRRIVAAFAVLYFSFVPVFATEAINTRYPDYSTEFIGHDRFETFNRRMFNFNEKLNKIALRPLHVIWASIMPKYGMERIKMAYDNIEYPKKLVSCLLQKDIKGANRETLRFLTNSTLGLGGMFDPAKRFLKLEPTNEDIEQGLAKCKIKQGPYLVLPVISSATPRSVAGKIIETGLDPTFYFASPVTALVKFGLFMNNTSMLQPLSIFLENSFADPYDIRKKIFGAERYIRLSNLDRKETISDEIKKLEEFNHQSESLLVKNEAQETILGEKIPNEVQSNHEENNAALNENLALHDEILKGRANAEENVLKEAVESKLNPDILLQDFNPQSPVIDSMRTALLEMPEIHKSFWSEMSIWNHSFSKRIKNGQIQIYEGRAPLTYKYILQKEKNTPLAILYPSIGESIMSSHLAVFAKIFYDAGYSVLIQGSHFHFAFINSIKEGYAPGLPETDCKELRLVTGKIIDKLEEKHKMNFTAKTLFGTSFGALATLYVANLEKDDPKIKIDNYISVNPPIELMYAIKQVDTNSDDWIKNKNEIKHRTAVSASKILDLYKTKDEDKNYMPKTLPFNDYEAKLITSFIMRQKLSDVIFTLENNKTSDKKVLYAIINNTSFKDYAHKYLMKNLNKSYDEIAYNSSLYSISDYLKNSNNYKIYHSMDDYLTTPEQLKKLKTLTGKNTIIMSNGGHLGYLYRDEFLKSLKEQITLKNELVAQSKM